MNYLHRVLGQKDPIPRPGSVCRIRISPETRLGVRGADLGNAFHSADIYAQVKRRSVDYGF